MRTPEKQRCSPLTWVVWALVCRRFLRPFRRKTSCQSQRTSQSRTRALQTHYDQDFPFMVPSFTQWHLQGTHTTFFGIDTIHHSLQVRGNIQCCTPRPRVVVAIRTFVNPTSLYHNWPLRTCLQTTSFGSRNFDKSEQRLHKQESQCYRDFVRLIKRVLVTLAL